MASVTGLSCCARHRDGPGVLQGDALHRRRVLIGFALVALLLASVAIGIAVARWPYLVQEWHAPHR